MAARPGALDPGAGGPGTGGLGAGEAGTAPLSAAFLHRLAAGLSAPAALFTDPADCLAYGFDNSRRNVPPGAVVLAAAAADAIHAVRACFEAGVPLTVRGRGTNTTGAAVPLAGAGGVVLSLERMDRITRFVPADRRLTCEPGTLNGAVQEAARPHGLFWPPDPTSAAYSTVGGNLACSAGGPKAVKYGTARDHVLALTAVTGDGRVIRTGQQTTKGVVGYDLTRLLVGSEGTLAVILDATLKLSPVPEAVATLRACYGSAVEAARAVARVMAGAVTPRVLEFFDATAVRLADDYQPLHLPAGTRSLLLVEVDGPRAALPAATRAVLDALAGPGCLDAQAAADAGEAERLWACRKALSPAQRRLAPKKINEDVAVPVSRLPELVAGLEALAAEHDLLLLAFGHAGNGNLHVNLLIDPADLALARRAEACLHAVFRLALALEGTISGEHGVGVEKRPFVAWEIDAPTLGLMQAVKRVFDPRGILNPGKTLPDP